MMSIVTRNLGAMEEAVSPDNLASTKTSLDEIADRRFIAIHGEESWHAYQGARGELPPKSS